MTNDMNGHSRMERLLGAWAMEACSPAEAEQVEAHLAECAECRAESERLRSAVPLLQSHTALDMVPSLRAEVLGACLSARSPEVAVPEYAKPYDAETARLDALLRDMSDEEWRAPVQLEWLEGEESATRRTSVAGVVGHLLAVDGMVSVALGLPDPLKRDDGSVMGPDERTEELWRQTGPEDAPADDSGAVARPSGSESDHIHETWRDQTYELIRTASFGGEGVADIGVPYGEGVVLPLRLALLDRAFETWIHATDIADAVDYPYPPPIPEHLRTLIGVAVQMLPNILAARRQAGLASPPLPMVEPGAGARSVRLEIEGESGGEWYLPVDSADGPAGPENCVGHVVLPEVEFCRLAAGHVPPRRAAAGQEGDKTAVLELLYAMASMSRL